MLWDVTTAGPPRCPVWWHLCSTVYRRKRPRNTQNGRSVLLIVNLMADSKSRSPHSYLSFTVTMRLSHLVSEIFTCHRQMNEWTDNADHYYNWPHIANKAKHFKTYKACNNYMIHQLLRKRHLSG